MIEKKETYMRKPIPAEERLAITLRFLATGESYESLMFQFRVHRTTIAKIIREVCKAIYEVLMPVYMKIPNEESEWLRLCDASFERWNFPHCFAAADGKHIAITKPPGSGSMYYNYKGFFSIVLMALVDYDYKFLAVDVGCQGRISDGGVFKNSQLFSAFKNNTVNIPKPKPLPNSSSPDVPFFFVADDAFSLSEFCMKPFSVRNLTELLRIFNYRLSRKRRVSENAFGIWGNRFRLFSVRNNLDPDTTTLCVLASLVLHNMLREKSREFYTPPGYTDEVGPDSEILDGRWRDEQRSLLVSDLQPGKSNRSSLNAENVRNILAEYCYGPGQVPWQWKLI